MATVIAVRGGVAISVYDDRFRFLFEALGVLTIERASEVEYDAASGDWVAVHKRSGAVIGRGKDRSEVIRQEVQWLEENQIHCKGEEKT